MRVGLAAQGRNDLTVDLDAPGLDQLLAVAAAAQPGGSQDFLQTLFVAVLICFIAV